MKLELSLADVCLCDYWQGSHKAHIAIPVYHGMTLAAIREAMRYEIRCGAIGGNDRIAYLLGSDLVKPEEEKEADKAVKAAYTAINRVKHAKKGERRFFKEFEKDVEEYADTVYAYFVFDEI